MELWRDVVLGFAGVVSGVTSLLYKSTHEKIDQKADIAQVNALESSLDEHKTEFGAFLSKFHDHSVDEMARFDTMQRDMDSKFNILKDMMQRNHVELIRELGHKANRKDE